MNGSGDMIVIVVLNIPQGYIIAQNAGQKRLYIKNKQRGIKLMEGVKI